MLKKTSWGWGNPLFRWLGIWDLQDLPVFIAALALFLFLTQSYQVITDKLWAQFFIGFGGALTIPILWNVYVCDVRKNHFAPFPWPWWRCPNEDPPRPARAGPVENVGGSNMVHLVVIGPDAKHLTSGDEVTKFQDDAEVSIVGFFTKEDSDAHKAFLKVAGAIDDYPFGVVYGDEATSTAHKVTGDAIVLFKKFDEGRNDLTSEFTEEVITKFIKGNALPLIVDFNHETAQKVFGGEIKSHVLMFLSKEAGHYDKYLETQKKVAGDYRDRVLFVTINTDDENHGRMMAFFDMKKEDVPDARLTSSDIFLIRLVDEPTTDVLGGDGSAMKTFVNDFLDGKLKQHLLSQELPEDWDKHPVKTLVASNFDEVVFDAEKHVLVEFYAPWCGHCKQLAPIYDQLGEKFESDSSIVIAKIDATATVNKLEHTKINNFPTIKLYKKGDNKVIEYSGETTLEGLTRFLESDGEYGQSAPNEAEEEDEDDDIPKKDEL